MYKRNEYTPEQKRMNRKLMVDNMTYLFQKYYPVWVKQYPQEAAEFINPRNKTMQDGTGVDQI